MSIEAVWDLQAKGSPRSLAVYPAVTTTRRNSAVTTTNPFDASNQQQQQQQQQQKASDPPVAAVVVGTVNATLHYRTYPITMITGADQGGGGGGRSGGVGTFSSSTTSSNTTTTTNASSGNSKTILPLGRRTHHPQEQQSQQSQIPRHLFPMDLQSLPGPIVSVVSFSTSSTSSSTTSNASSSSTRRSSASTHHHHHHYQHHQQQQHQPQTFVLLIEDGRGSVTAGMYTSMIVTASLALHNPGFQVVATSPSQQIRMSCATAVDNAVYYAAGRRIYKLYTINVATNTSASSTSTPGGTRNSSSYFPHALPAPGIRSGQDALAVIANHKVAVAAVGNSFYAVTFNKEDDTNNNTVGEENGNVLKIATFQQSSQVHPVIVIDLHDKTVDAHWSSLFLASGRECAVVDVYYNDGCTSTAAIMSSSSGMLSASKPRNGTVLTASPILAAAAVTPWVAVLTSDGLVSIRSPSCLAIPLRTVEVGQRPNDYFVLRSLSPTSPSWQQQRQDREEEQECIVVAAAYSGEAKVLQCHADTAQDLADRLMRHAIDAFGSNGFPRSELAAAVQASFTATSYVGPPETSPQARLLLQQYLEAVLGLADFESGGSSGWPTEFSQSRRHQRQHQAVHRGTFGGDVYNNKVSSSTAAFSGRGDDTNNTDAMMSRSFSSAASAVVSAASPAALLTGTALLCLVCSQLSPTAPNNSVLANRAAKSCSEKMGVVFESTSADSSSNIPPAAIQVCEQVAEKLLREASSNFSLLTGSSPTPITRANNRSSQSSLITDFIEAAIWLLRSCGKHERAIEVAYERLQQQQQTSPQGQTSEIGAENVRGVWSQIKYESYTATHLSEIWGAGKDEGCQLVLSSPVTNRLLENNPRLGLSVFTALHPQNEAQWRALPAREDPLAHVERVYKVLELLKTIKPAIPSDKDRSFSNDADAVNLPLESGRAVAVSFLWSAIGISSGRSADSDEFDSMPVDTDYEEHVANFHDELSFLLLEGVILERPEGDQEQVVDTELGRIYRSMLRQFLKWPLTLIRPDLFMESLPPAFLQEKALVLGRLGRHDDALQILYRDLKNLDLALEYCDDRYAQQKEEEERRRTRQQKENIYHRDSSSDDPMFEGLKMKEEDNAYLPLIRVALESEDAERGTATAIKVLALRRSAIDRAAALRLLPSEVPVSAVARPFLIPALVESESQVRRMTVVSALLRSRYLRLKEKLTTAQLRAQANIHVVPALRSLNLGDPLHSTKSFRVRTNSNPSPTMPDVQIVKHFFPRHLVIQAKVTNVPFSVYSSSSSSSLYATSDKSTSHFQQTLLSDIAFVVAESSEEEAIQPLLQVPIQLLPPKMTGSAWCVMSASPNNMDGSTAQLTCELRYSVQSVDASSSAVPASIGSTAMIARTYVEELQDLEVHSAHFS